MTMKVADQTIPVTIISITPESATTIPPASVHPVVLAQGKMVSFLSPVELQLGATFQMESGLDIPYSVRVQSCTDKGQGEFHVLGIIV